MFYFFQTHTTKAIKYYNPPAEDILIFVKDLLNNLITNKIILLKCFNYQQTAA